MSEGCAEIEEKVKKTKPTGVREATIQEEIDGYKDVQDMIDKERNGYVRNP